MALTDDRRAQLGFAWRHHQPHAGAALDGYEQAFDDARSDENDTTQRPKAVRIAMEEALHRSRRQLARENIDHVRPHIPLGKRFWPLSGDEKQAIQALFKSDGPRWFAPYSATRRTVSRRYVSSMPLTG